MPLLAGRYDVIAPTMLGHRGGRPAGVRPACLEHIVVDAQRLLDELGLGQPHLAGNSLGGRVALELARLGRARTVCALSPSGLGGRLEDHRRATRLLRRCAPPALAPGAACRPFAALPALGAARHRRPRRASEPAELLGLTDDLLGCTVVEDLFGEAARLAPLDPPPCPITLAWAARDRVFPLQINGANARELIRGARWIVLDDVGHVPMLDDPQLVAQTILTATTAIPPGNIKEEGRSC